MCRSALCARQAPQVATWLPPVAARGRSHKSKAPCMCRSAPCARQASQIATWLPPVAARGRSHKSKAPCMCRSAPCARQAPQVAASLVGARPARDRSRVCLPQSQGFLIQIGASPRQSVHMASDQPSGYAALRRHRYSMPQHIYHVTSVTAGRVPIFKSQAAVIAARDFATQRLWGDAEPLAWVVMPDHAHWLIQLGQHDALSTVMNRIKSATARHVRMHSPSIYPVWACGYHEHQVHRDTDLAMVAQYIVMNPVRAGLADKAGDYPFWNSVFL